MSKKILIFGGSGFIGSALTQLLLSQNFHVCVICTNRKKAAENLSKNDNLTIQTIDIFNQKKLQELVKNHDIIINLIGKLFESQKGDFQKFHHEFAKTLSEITTPTQHLIHLSALGIENSNATSLYAKTKLDGEQSIIKNCPNYNIIKPSIVFGKHDNFFNQFANMAKISPFLPAIGGGKTKFAPIHVDDINKAILTLINDQKTHPNKIFEAHGPVISTFKELLQFILTTTKKRRILLPLPFFVAKIQAHLLNLCRIFLLTPDQVRLLKYDNISHHKHDNIDKLIGKLGNYKEITPNYLK